MACIYRMKLSIEYDDVLLFAGKDVVFMLCMCSLCTFSAFLGKSMFRLFSLTCHKQLCIIRIILSKQVNPPSIKYTIRIEILLNEIYLNTLFNILYCSSKCLLPKDKPGPLHCVHLITVHPKVNFRPANIFPTLDVLLNIDYSQNIQ